MSSPLSVLYRHVGICQLVMESENDTPELISMLKYMKDTRIDNPEILIKDSWIIELDDIVTEIKKRIG